MDGAKDSKGKHWRVNISEAYPVIVNDIYAVTEKEAQEEINRFLDEITDTVQLVETELLKHKDELIQMKKDAEAKSS